MVVVGLVGMQHELQIPQSQGGKIAVGINQLCSQTFCRTQQIERYQRQGIHGEGGKRRRSLRGHPGLAGMSLRHDLFEEDSREEVSFPCDGKSAKMAAGRRSAASRPLARRPRAEEDQAKAQHELRSAGRARNGNYPARLDQNALIRDHFLVLFAGSAKFGRIIAMMPATTSRIPNTV